MSEALNDESFEEDDDAADLMNAPSGLDQELNDEFLDSEAEEQNEAMFSDDDSSLAEEKLTAANIEGLSRQLDAQKSVEEAEAQLELEEAVLQTNIDGERPKVVEDDPDSDASLSDPTHVKSTLRLAPDLQLLRTRMTETVRVLDSFHTLAEPGRSRSDYTAQLLKDICAYYGYSPFLAEKVCFRNSFSSTVHTQTFTSFSISSRQKKRLPSLKPMRQLVL